LYSLATSATPSAGMKPSASLSKSAAPLR
jgi:hypothetical protein